MPTLRNSLINEILDELVSQDFGLEDFDRDFPDDSPELARITFKPYPEYTFVIAEGTSSKQFNSFMAGLGQRESSSFIRTIESPGSYKNEESIKHEDIDSAVRKIPIWISNIREDLASSRATSDSNFDDFTESLYQSINQKVDDPDSYFDSQEEDTIKSKLDELHRRVSELESERNFTDEEAKEIERTIERSKSDLKIYPKGVWYKTAGTKIVRVIGRILKSKEARELTADLARKLLL